MSASFLPKSQSRHQVLSIIAPHEFWPATQPYRTQFVPDLRCGPHVNLVDPFVPPEHFPQAAQILKPHVVQLEPFKCKLNLQAFGRAIYPKSATLFVECQFEPKDAFHRLMDVMVKVFPQCNDLSSRSPNGRYVPHITLGKFNDEAELEEALLVIKRTWEDSEFPVKEIYMLSRIGGDPFEIKEVIPLGKAPKTPAMGPGNNIQRISGQYTRTLVVAGIHSGMKEKQIMKLFTGWRPVAAEVVKNGNGKARPLAIVEFQSERYAKQALEAFVSDEFPKLYLRPVSLMTFPGVVGDCCSMERISFSLRNEHRLREIDTFRGIETKTAFAPLDPEGEATAPLLNAGVLHHNSNEIRSAVTENLNATSIYGLEIGAEDWETFIQGFQYSSDSWADMVEKEEATRMSVKEQKAAKAKVSKPEIISFSPDDEKSKKRQLHTLVKRYRPLSSTELMNLLSRQQNDGSWCLKSLETYFNISSERMLEFLDGCGLKSMGKSLREKGAEMLSTMMVLSYLCAHFGVPVFSFAAIRASASRKQPIQKWITVFETKMEQAHDWTKKNEALIPSLSDRLSLGVNWEVAMKGLWQPLFDVK